MAGHWFRMGPGQLYPGAMERPDDPTPHGPQGLTWFGNL